MFVVFFFSAFVRTWVRDQPCVVGARAPQVTVVDRRGKHTLPFFFCEYVFFCCCFFILFSLPRVSLLVIHV